MLKGIYSGRSNRGNIYVFASGNGALANDDCNYDSYANAPYTIAIGALLYSGTIAPYSEGCAALMGVTYSGLQPCSSNKCIVRESTRLHPHGGKDAVVVVVAR